MPLIRLLTSRAGLRFVQNVGDVLEIGKDISAREAATLVERKQAEHVTDEETTSLAAPEKPARTRRGAARIVGSRE